jgi:hypothetical protein
MTLTVTAHSVGRIRPGMGGFLPTEISLSVFNFDISATRTKKHGHVKTMLDRDYDEEH